MALIAASASCVDRVTRRRRSPTALVSQENAGTVMTATMVSCQLRMIIATMVETKMTTLARIVEAVVVTMVWTPSTLARRPAGDIRFNGVELQQHARGLLVVTFWYEWWHSGFRRFLWFHADTRR